MLNSLGMIEVLVTDECCTYVILLHVLSFCMNFIFKYPLLGNISLDFNDDSICGLTVFRRQHILPMPWFK